VVPCLLLLLPLRLLLLLLPLAAPQSARVTRAVTAANTLRVVPQHERCEGGAPPQML